MSTGWDRSVVHRRRKNDLPPKWDGVPVVWSGWKRLENNPLRPRFDDRCTVCGSVEQRHVNIGRMRIVPEGGAERSVIGITTRRPVTHVLALLSAFRCAGCGRDEVCDSDGVLWTLDASDYGADGSFPTGVSDRSCVTLS